MSDWAGVAEKTLELAHEPRKLWSLIVGLIIFTVAALFIYNRIRPQKQTAPSVQQRTNGHNNRGAAINNGVIN